MPSHTHGETGVILDTSILLISRTSVLSLALCYFVLVFFSPFGIAITSLGEERAYLSVFRTICACLVLSVSSSSWCL